MTYKIKKIITFPFLLLIILNGCATSSVSLLGPALTGFKSGSIYQTGISYTSSNIIKNQLGAHPTEIITKLLIKEPTTSKATNITKLLIKEPTTSKATNVTNIKKNVKNIKYTKIYRDIDNDYSEFVIAVKKMLK